MMRKRLTFLKTLTAAVAVIVLFTACEQFLKDPEDFLSYWASEAFVKDHSIGWAARPDGAGVPCVSSSEDVTIMLTVHNPKGFSFVMPASLEPAGIVEFKELSSQPAAGTHYNLERTSSSRLKLTYKKAFLQKYEQGSGSLNPTITLKATDGRVFKKTYTFGIKSNTPPPKPKKIVIAKTKGSDPHYVLCLQFDSAEMTRKIGTTTVPIHKDIAKITINDVPYTLLYNNDNSDFKKPDETSFIERGNVQQLTAALPSASEKWVLYFNTGVKVESSNPQTSYTITLRDKGGVVSDSVTAELKEKFKVEFNAQGGTPEPDTQYIPNGGKVTEPTNPAQAGYTFGGWYASSTFEGSAWAFDTDTVTGNMTLYAKWTEQKHTVKFKVVDNRGGELRGSYGGQTKIANGGNDGSEQTFTNVSNGHTVSFTAVPDSGWKVEKWTLDGSEVPGHTSTIYELSNITGDKTVKVEFEKVTAVAGSDNFAWKLLKDAVKVADDGATITITGRIEATTYDENKGEIVIDKNLIIKSADGAVSAVLDANRQSRIFKVASGKTLTLENLTLKGGKANGKEDEDKCGGAIYAKDASTVNITNCIITGNEAAKNGGGLNVGGTPTTITNCTFTGNTAKNGGGIYINNDSYTVVTISGGTIGGTGTNEANKATGTGSDGNGGGVYANKADVSMKNDTQIAINNDVYLDNTSLINVFSALSNNPAARITVPNGEYLTSTKVLFSDTPGLLSSEHGKFQVTPKDGEQWEVGSDGCLKKKQ